MKTIFNLQPTFGSVICAVCGLALASVTVAQAQQFNYATLAGYAGQQNTDGTGTNAFLTQTAGSAVDSSGNIYVSDYNNNTIRKITSAGVVTTLAGKPGVAGSFDGNGTNALFNGPEGLAVDGGGNVYVADSGNNTIRMITSAGVVSTFAGYPGVAGSGNGTGTNAFFFAPADVAVDINSNVYVADYGNHDIRKITPAGAVSTLAGSGSPGSADGTGTLASFNEPEGVAVDALGNVFVADTANDTVRKITSAGVVSTLAGSAGNYGYLNSTGTNALFNSPAGVAVDITGNVYVADTGNNLIRQVNALGAVSTVAGSGAPGSRDGSGTNALFWAPVGIAADSGSNLYVADYFNGTVRKVTTLGGVSTLAGSASNGSADGADSSARFSQTQGIAVDGSGNIYVADAANNTIRRITGGSVLTLAGSAGKAGSSNGSGTNALFNAPQAIATDASGNIYVADTLNDTVRKVTSLGSVTTLAGYPGYANNSDGTGTNAQFNAPQGIAVDSSGNIYVADTLNHTIRMVTQSGVVTTIAGTPGSYGSLDSSTNQTALFNQPKGLALDSAKNIYVADSMNHTIRRITQSNTVTTIAGTAGVWGSADGTNNNALFFQPSALTIDSSGNIYVADAGNQTIRMIMPSGTNWVVTTIGGQATVSGSADGYATLSQFNYPGGIALDSSANLYVADSGNNTIRYGNLLPVTSLNNLSAQPHHNSAIIYWTTGTPSTSQVAYGTTPSYGGLTAYDSTPVTNHAVMLTGLATNQLYYFEAVSYFGPAQGTATGSFNTDPSIIMTSPQASYLGVWVNSSSVTDNYSPVYKYASVAPAAPAASATFRPTIPSSGEYDVSIWYSEGANRSALAPVTVSYLNGSYPTAVNETLPGGSWHLITSGQNFAAGTNQFVQFGNYTGETNKIVISDAVKWTYTAGQDMPSNGNPPAWWTSFYYGSNVSGSTIAANGYSILNDYILGIAPNDANTHLNLGIQHGTNSTFKAVFSPLVGGRTYQLQSTTNLAHPVWQTLANYLVTQDTNGNGVITCTNVSGSTARTFYRLSVQLAP